MFRLLIVRTTVTLQAELSATLARATAVAEKQELRRLEAEKRLANAPAEQVGVIFSIKYGAEIHEVLNWWIFATLIICGIFCIFKLSKC